MTTEVNSLIESISEKFSDFEKEKRKLADSLKENFQTIFMPIFEKYPEIKAFGWTQYTPYFNDGESCEFSVNELSAAGGDDEVDERDWLWEGLPSLDYKDKTKLSSYAQSWATLEMVHDLDALNEAFTKIPDDVFENMFGDHVYVVVDRDGVTVEEYDHD